MKALNLIPLFLLMSIFATAQTLKIETAEKLFSQSSSTELLFTLKTNGFNSLSDDEILEEDFMASSKTNDLSTKDRLYTSKGLKKIYELRKGHYGGLCKLTVKMNEPYCKTVQRLTWNANLSYDTRVYVRELEALGYNRAEGTTIDKYVNKEKGFTITIKISQRTNELTFLMSKAT